MFTFKNKNTPIIADGTQVERAGLRFTIIHTHYHYNVYMADPQGEWAESVEMVAMIPKAGRWGRYDWAAGAQEVEEAIIRAAESRNAIEEVA